MTIIQKKMMAFCLPASVRPAARPTRAGTTTFTTAVRSPWSRHARPARTSYRAATMCSESPSLEEQFDSADYLDRIRAINRANSLPSSSTAVEKLVHMTLKDSNPQVRYAAISRLSNLDMGPLSPSDEQVVLDAARHTLANDKEPSCQSGAADLIAGLKLFEGFGDLVSIFGSTDDWMIKFSIAASVGEMGHPDAFEFLRGIVDDEDNKEFLLLAAAVGSLGELGDERAVPIVTRFLDHEDSSIQERAKIALDRLRPSAEAPGA